MITIFKEYEKIKKTNNIVILYKKWMKHIENKIMNFTKQIHGTEIHLCLPMITKFLSLFFSIYNGFINKLISFSLL